MFRSLNRVFRASLRVVFVCAAIVGCFTVAMSQAQSDAADLQGVVRDPSGAVVANASITARNTATNVTREANTNDDGFYKIVRLAPGIYEVTVKATNYKTAVIPSVKLTVGQTINQDVPLEVGELTATVTVTSVSPNIVETTNTNIATIIDTQRIENLPINERNYLSFALTSSTVSRDAGRPIGPAPTTGLNFGGQRGRSNLVQVDGADNTDNSVNASRSTVSQEAVQEFQVVSNSFAPEFGRSAGGVVNVVTKSGTNDLHGDVFGFLRHKSFQARNAFAPIAEPPFTRAQYGGTLGGTFDKDRTFFFGSFEQRQRHESGFFTSNVSAGLSSSVTIGAPFLPFTQTFGNMTSRQSGYVSGLLTTAGQLIATGVPANVAQGQALANAAVQYAYLASSGGVTALTGTNPLISAGGSVPAGQVIGPRFFLSGAPVPSGTTNAAGQFIAFRPLQSLQTVFPVTDKTTFNSIRIDHLITKDNHLTMRFGYNPSTITGIQVESQNQSLGQNDFSRTGVQRLKDYSFVATLASTLSNSMVNEARFNFGERRATFKSQNPDAVAFNISGTAFIGRELFSPVVRTETRYEWTDALNVVSGTHTFKFGGDYASVNIPSAIFQLNFAGLYNFGGLSATTLAAFPTVGTLAPPDFTAVQQYGLGFPSNFIQGYGNPVSKIGNKPIAWFAQDSWKIKHNFTFNYGVRYDVELTQTLPPVASFTDPLSGITLTQADLLAAQDAVNVQQGFPRDKNNFAPRVGFAWDIKGNAKTVIRGAAGIFYDHPLLAIGFNSDIADAAQQQQGVFISGSPSPTALLNATQIFQGTVCVPGAPATPFCAALPPGVVTPGVAPGSQYQFGRQRFNDQTFPGFGPVLPFTLPVTKNFKYAYANQANFTVERQITKDMSISGSYLFVGAHHLPHPLDINAPRTELQIANFARYANRNPTNTTEALLVGGACPGPTCFFPTNLPAGAAFANPLLAGDVLVNIIPGMIVLSPTRGKIVSPAIANFFRPNAPNYFLAQAASGGLVTKAVLDSQLGGSLRTPGAISPFGSINAQVSDGNSVYHAMNIDLKKRFSHNFQFLASYTWSHAIDDSSDLQTLLLPQDNRSLRSERSDALFDQRQRFVFSGVLASPAAWRNGDGMHKFLADFTLAPILEISSGRPFNILSNQDTNNDQSNQTDRPSVLPNGLLCVPGTAGCTPLIVNGQFATGDLARNMGLTHRYMSVDARLTRSIRFGERLRLDVIAEGFNLFNRFNEAAASPFIDAVNAFHRQAGNGHYYSQPTSAFDPRQFQFGLKLNW
ncbi:MAG TPA: carboxypeptidase regulatory-like domain-containing protein [Pyrinomonadaceae bacterium]|nr:carboxypeptidase regulatory-like domain-containing protein [Pyrinomonadaceae bacterium]